MLTWVVDIVGDGILSGSRYTNSFSYAVIILPMKVHVCTSNLKMTNDIIHHIPYVVLDWSMSMSVYYQ